MAEAADGAARKRRRTLMQCSDTPGSSITTAPNKPKVIIITGPSGVGKTKVSISVAKACNGEIISADSVQVYKGLDVGSDKITTEEQQGVPHHLLDILEPHQEFSAGDFYQNARAATEDILQRGKTPVVVGGTGFYLRWYMHGKADTPRSNPESAAKVEAELAQAWKEAEAQHGRELTPDDKWEVGVQLLAARDPDAANKVRQERNNYYRLKRVMEIAHLSGGRSWADQKLNQAAPLDYDFRAFFLHRPRLNLFDLVLDRCEQMVEGGLIQEAQWMLEQGLRPNSCSASRAIGYRQAMQFLMDRALAGSPVEGRQVQQLVLETAAVTRRLGKAQMNWFRDDDYFRWIDAAQHSVPEVVELILHEAAQPFHQGDCGTSGRLSKEDAVAIKRYIPQLRRLADKEVLARVVAQVQESVDCLRKRVFVAEAVAAESSGAAAAESAGVAAAESAGAAAAESAGVAAAESAGTAAAESAGAAAAARLQVGPIAESAPDAVTESTANTEAAAAADEPTGAAEQEATATAAAEPATPGEPAAAVSSC